MADAPDVAYGLALRFKVSLQTHGSLGTWAKVEGLDVSWDVAEYKAGDAANFKWYFPAGTSYTKVKLTRAVSPKGTADVLKWLADISFKHKKEWMLIEMFDAQNKDAVAKWHLDGVVPIHYTGPQFDATASRVATETLEVIHLGFFDPTDGSNLA